MFDPNPVFSYVCFNHPPKLTYLYQKSDFIAISRWFHSLENNVSLPTGGQACPLTVPVTDSIAHSLTTENKVHFHNEEEGGKGKGRHRKNSKAQRA